MLPSQCPGSLGHNEPPIQWVPGSLIMGVTGPGCKAAHSSLSNSEVKNEWSYTSAPPLGLPGMQKDFTFFTVLKYSSQTKTRHN